MWSLGVVRDRARARRETASALVAQRAARGRLGRGRVLGPCAATLVVGRAAVAPVEEAVRREDADVPEGERERDARSLEPPIARRTPRRRSSSSHSHGSKRLPLATAAAQRANGATSATASAPAAASALPPPA